MITYLLANALPQQAFNFRPMRYMPFLFTLLVLILACGKDAPASEAAVDDPNAPSLVGHWVLEEAKRNNRVTETLTDLYFSFQENGQFATNLGGDHSEGTYQYDGSTEIVTADLAQAYTYQIAEHSDDELVLHSRISNFDFEFVLKRGEPELPEEDTETSSEEI